MMYQNRVRILDTANCNPYWHGRTGTVIDTEYDMLVGEFYWTVRIDNHDDVTVPFAEHELERI